MLEQAPLNEIGPLNVTTFLLFDSAANLADKALRRALEQEHPLVVLPVASPPTRRAFAPMAPGDGEGIAVHPSAHLLGLSARWGGTIGAGRAPAANSSASLVLRWMNTAESGGAIAVPLAPLVRALTGAEAGRVRCTELTLTNVDSRADAEARRLRWAPAAHVAAPTETVAPRGGGGDACDAAAIAPLDMRTYEFTWG